VNFTLVMLDLQRWEPFALSASLMVFPILHTLSTRNAPGEIQLEGLRSRPTS
jgi:hypothetical protein